MELTNERITRYRHGNFLIDIVDDGGTYSAWIMHKDYGVSALICGCPKTEMTEERFISVIECNVDEAIPWYEEEYMGIVHSAEADFYGE